MPNFIHAPSPRSKSSQRARELPGVTTAKVCADLTELLNDGPVAPSTWPELDLSDVGADEPPPPAVTPLPTNTDAQISAPYVSVEHQQQWEAIKRTLSYRPPVPPRRVTLPKDLTQQLELAIAGSDLSLNQARAIARGWHKRLLTAEARDLATQRLRVIRVASVVFSRRSVHVDSTQEDPVIAVLAAHVAAIDRVERVILDHWRSELGIPEPFTEWPRLSVEHHMKNAAGLL